MTLSAGIFAAAWMFAMWLTWLRARRSRTPFEFGLVTLGIVAGYYLLPGLVAQAAGIVENALDPACVNLIAEYGTTYVLAFGISYFLVESMAVRSRHSLPGQRAFKPGDWTLALILFGVLELAFVAINIQYVDLSGDYVSNYAQAQAIPGGLRQVIGYLEVLSAGAELVLIRSLKNASARTERTVLIGLACFHIVESGVTQARVFLVRFVITLAFQLNLTKNGRRYPLSLQLGAIGAVVVAMNLFAVLRGVAEGADISGRSVASMLVPGEFVTVYLNAYRLASEHLSGTAISPPGIPYLSDILKIVPAAFAPWPKIDLSAWFVGEYFPEYAATGGGLAFGAIAEALVNYGLISAAFQGLALGAFLGYLSGIAKRPGTSLPIWFTCLYLTVASGIHYPIRTTTFSVIGGLVNSFVVPYLLCRLAMYVLRCSCSAPRNLVQGPAPRGS